MEENSIIEHTPDQNQIKGKENYTKSGVDSTKVCEIAQIKSINVL